ncbi:MAG TPA: glycosyltransferase family 4 protein [Solirubrobacteraceae bacterium]|nr:glycosyltransferase family 4 protein [Solirubrobacteraceae bacterium]
MKVHVLDPSAYTPPYDHALCAALARAGAAVELYTSAFPYAALPEPQGYLRREHFYRRARGEAGSRRRRVAKSLEHVPDMLRYRAAARAADVVHFQWLAVPAVDTALLPRRVPLVLTAHDEPLAAARYRRFDAVIAHSEHGRRRLLEAGVAERKAHLIPHGVFAHLAALEAAPAPAELRDDGTPVVLCFGLLRPYKGLDVLLDAWRGIERAQLWIVGRPRYDVSALRAAAPPSVQWVTRFVDDRELAACFRRADLVVAPYRRSEQSGVVATALAFGCPLLLSDVGGFGEVAAAGAARLVPPGDPAALRSALEELLADPGERERLAARGRALAAGEWSWERVAERTLQVYRALLS